MVRREFSQYLPFPGGRQRNGLPTLFTESLDFARGHPVPQTLHSSPTDDTCFHEDSEAGANCCAEDAADDSDTWSTDVNFESEERDEMAEVVSQDMIRF